MAKNVVSMYEEDDDQVCDAACDAAHQSIPAYWPPASTGDATHMAEIGHKFELQANRPSFRLLNPRLHQTEEADTQDCTRHNAELGVACSSSPDSDTDQPTTPDERSHSDGNLQASAGTAAPPLQLTVLNDVMPDNELDALLVRLALGLSDLEDVDQTR